MIEMSVSGTARIRDGRQMKASVRSLPVGEKRSADFQYMAVLIKENDISLILEILGDAARFKNGGKRVHTCVLTTRRQTDFFKKSGLFDEVIPLNHDKSVRRFIRKRKPDVLHVPYQGLWIDFYLRLSGKARMIGGGRSNRLKRLLGFLDPSKPEDRSMLNMLGFSTSMIVEHKIDGYAAADDLPERYIWLNLYGLSQSSLKWSSGHAARLARLLKKEGVSMVIPVCRDAMENDQSLDLEYLKTSADGVVLYDACDLEARLRGMVGARAIIGTQGPEMTLAGLTSTPSLVLQTATQAKNRELMLVADQDQSGDSKNSESYITPFRVNRISGRFLSPDDQDPCGSGCENCGNGPCIDRISPERVYESLLTFLFPV
jgi:ADP-heptose:LPS heptosyltransferase